ncbi:hypothetical protein GE21DRAFT_1291949 [Neurospora crassa]|nr:hypothetical protein GE21DRAFT_1291949 [Neurospora crassa]
MVATVQVLCCRLVGEQSRLKWTQCSSLPVPIEATSHHHGTASDFQVRFSFFLIFNNQSRLQASITKPVISQSAIGQKGPQATRNP